MDNVNTYYEGMAKLIAKAYEMTDEVLAAECTKLFATIPTGYMINHRALNKLLARRVGDYCLINKINIEDYDGPLAYRVFKIETETK